MLAVALGNMNKGRKAVPGKPLSKYGLQKGGGRKMHLLDLLSKLFSSSAYRIRISVHVAYKLNHKYFTLTILPVKLVLFPFSSPLLYFHPLSFTFSFFIFPSSSFTGYFFQIIFSIPLIQPSLNLALSTKRKVSSTSSSQMF